MKNRPLEFHKDPPATRVAPENPAVFRRSRRKTRPRRGRVVFALAVISVLAALAVYSAVQIAGYFADGAQNRRLTDSLQEEFFGTQDKAALPSLSPDAAMNALLSLQKINPDAIGWLSIPGTDIS